MEKFGIIRSEKKWSDPSRKISSVVWIFYLDYLRALVCQKLVPKGPAPYCSTASTRTPSKEVSWFSLEQRVPFHPLVGDDPTMNLIDSHANEQQPKFCRIQFHHRASGSHCSEPSISWFQFRVNNPQHHPLHGLFGNEHRPFITDHFLSILVKARGSNRNNSWVGRDLDSRFESTTDSAYRVSPT